MKEKTELRPDQLKSSTLCEVVEVLPDNKVRVIVRQEGHNLEATLPIDKCPQLACVEGGSFYVDLYNVGSAKNPEYLARTRQVSVEEDRGFEILLDEVKGLLNKL